MTIITLQVVHKRGEVRVTVPPPISEAEAARGLPGRIHSSPARATAIMLSASDARGCLMLALARCRSRARQS